MARDATAAGATAGCGCGGRTHGTRGPAPTRRKRRHSTLGRAAARRRRGAASAPPRVRKRASRGGARREGTAEQPAQNLRANLATWLCGAGWRGALRGERHGERGVGGAAQAHAVPRRRRGRLAWSQKGALLPGQSAAAALQGRRTAAARHASRQTHVLVVDHARYNSARTARKSPVSRAGDLCRSAQYAAAPGAYRPPAQLCRGCAAAVAARERARLSRGDASVSDFSAR